MELFILQGNMSHIYSLFGIALIVGMVGYTILKKLGFLDEL